MFFTPLAPAVVCAPAGPDEAVAAVKTVAATICLIVDIVYSFKSLEKGDHQLHLNVCALLMFPGPFRVQWIIASGRPLIKYLIIKCRCVLRGDFLTVFRGLAG
jgi:hypothetical protein